VDDTLIFSARALVLADLQARRRATPDAVSVLEDAMSARTWWAEQWPEGEAYVAGLVAQDVQDALFETVGRWPVCLGCEGPEHALYIQPDLGGPDPVWVCEESGEPVAASSRRADPDSSAVLLTLHAGRPPTNRWGPGGCQLSTPSWTRRVYRSAR
jgi:hypothetical protein